MGFRSAEETLRARVLELETENAELREELARVTGQVLLEDDAPVATHGGEPIWSPGSSWFLGWHPPDALLAYTGESRDEAQYLRFLNLGTAAAADFELAKDGARNTLRAANAIIAPLADGSLAEIPWPGQAISRRITLSSPLVAQPIVTATGILAVNAARELLSIDPRRFVVTERRPVDAPELEQLGFPDGDARQKHNGWQREIDPGDGWKLVAFRELGRFDLCALSRSFAGNDQVGAGVAKRGTSRLVWFRELGAGDFIYLYGVDGMLVLHNVSLRVPPRCWAVWQATGAPVLTVSGRAPEATLDAFGVDGRVVTRAKL